MIRRLAVCSMVVLALTWGAAGQTSAQDAPPPPGTMASIGDSITRAADVCCWYGDHPANSWSTGGASWDGVTSHYERIRAVNPAIAGRNYNDAVSGAKMSSGPAQAQRAVTQQVQYVTLLLGANDLCTASPTTMTPVDTFRGQLHETLQILMGGLPKNALVFVSSIPDVYQLWQIYHTSWTARVVWDVADICQSLLAPSRTEEQRQKVRQRNVQFNAVLAEQCALYTRCRFDGNAVFNFQFSRADISGLDYFHPSLAGQAALASVTWAQSWWN
jgi:lysophospholipase L1-like esterase